MDGLKWHLSQAVLDEFTIRQLVRFIKSKLSLLQSEKVLRQLLTPLQLDGRSQCVLIGAVLWPLVVLILELRHGDRLVDVHIHESRRLLLLLFGMLAELGVGLAVGSL